MPEEYNRDLGPELRTLQRPAQEDVRRQGGTGGCAITQNERGTPPQEGYTPPQGDPADAAAAGAVFAGSARPHADAAAGDGAALQPAGGPAGASDAPASPQADQPGAPSAADVNRNGAPAPQGGPAGKDGAQPPANGRQVLPASRAICFQQHSPPFPARFSARPGTVQFSICRPKNVAAVCARAYSVSPAVFPGASVINRTEPSRSPWDRIGAAR